MKGDILFVKYVKDIQFLFGLAYGCKVILLKKSGKKVQVWLLFATMCNLRKMFIQAKSAVLLLLIASTYISTQTA